MSNSSSKGTALITGASRGIGAVYAHVEALDYDFDLSKLERVMSGTGTRHELT
jgi:short-subunit dehydrogenase